MLRRGEALPRWAREYGSGNSGEGEERPSVGWQERVEEMAEKEAVERRLQARRAAEEVRREVMGRLSGEVGDTEEVCGREVDGGAGEGSEDWEGAEVVPVRGIEEGGEARGDEATRRGLLCADLKARRVANPNAFERTDRAMDFFL